MIAWLVAALVMAINGYLLVDFFSSDVELGAIFGTVVCVIAVAYVSFIIYLVLRGIDLPALRDLLRPKTVVANMEDL